MGQGHGHGKERERVDRFVCIWYLFLYSFVGWVGLFVCGVGLLDILFVGMQDKFLRAIQILKNLNQPDRVINRDRINFSKLMQQLRSPYKSFKSIHITGTNGKGSVSIKTSKILENAGYRVGTYTSPHLFSFRQRIQINGESISRENITKHILRIDEISRQANLPLSYFQFLTAAGFLEFQNMGCQYVAVEVGLGGKNDTTNLIDPEVSVITSIGLDHMDLLGPTKDHIAYEKSGIIKPNRPVVLGPHAQGYSSIQQAIRINNCQVYQTPPHPYKNFQSQNNAITEQTIKCLQALNPSLTVSPQHIDTGLSATQPCRMQQLDSQYLPQKIKNMGKTVYFDVGHNLQAILKVKEYLKEKGYQSKEICIVFGTSRGKKFDLCLRELEEICASIYLVQAQHFRACPISQLQSYVGDSKYPYKFRIFNDGKIHDTLSMALLQQNMKVYVVCGSFFIMPQARGYFQPQLVSNPDQNINEIYQLHQKNK